MQVDEAMLVSAMQTKTAGLGGGSLAESQRLSALTGVPKPQGSHLRFDEESGKAVPSPAREKTLLKGVATPKGSHTRFDEVSY